MIYLSKSIRLSTKNKIDMDLMSRNQFDPLGDNENPNRFKT